MKIYGNNYTKDEVRKRVGDIGQIGGIKAVEFKDGMEKGVEGLQFRTGSGFNFMVLPSRAFDISNAEFNGISLAFISPTGVTHPAFYESEGYGWLRGFFGGLLTTCGLTYCGAPCVDEGVSLGLHGRISNISAKNVNVFTYWENDDYILSAEGEMRETVFFGENIVLRRKITTRIGSKNLVIDDVVENEGFEPTPHQMLYHINIGFPVVSEDSVLITPSETVTPRDKEAEAGKENYWKFQPPTKGFKEKVYYHKMKEDKDGYVTVALINRKLKSANLSYCHSERSEESQKMQDSSVISFPQKDIVGEKDFGIYVKYRKDTLPFFTEWKMMGEGLYVVGLEPGNTLVEGRVKERARGNLKILQAGEKVNYRVEIGVLTESEEIEGITKMRSMSMGMTSVSLL